MDDTYMAGWKDGCSASVERHRGGGVDRWSGRELERWRSEEVDARREQRSGTAFQMILGPVLGCFGSLFGVSRSWIMRLCFHKDLPINPFKGNMGIQVQLKTHSFIHPSTYYLQST